MTANRHGVDQDYFQEKLALLQRDLGNHTPQELARTLARLAKVADAAILEEPEFTVQGSMNETPDDERRAAWRDLVLGEKIIPGDRFLSGEGQWTEIEPVHLEFEDHVTEATRPTQRRVVAATAKTSPTVNTESDNSPLTPCAWCLRELPDEDLLNETEAGDAICDPCATAATKRLLGR